MLPRSRTQNPLARPWAFLFLAALFLALCFQGSRGLGSPDEGYYVGTADGMMNSGSLLLPLLNGRVFLEKPPLTYWGIAAGLEVFGRNEWGARAFHALCFALTALAVGLIGVRLWNPRVGLAAGTLYLFSILPFAASNIVTPDTPLALWTSLLMLFFLGGLEKGPWRSLHLALAGIAFGLGILTKGPAMLVFAYPIPFIAARRRKVGEILTSPGTWAGAVLGAALGLSWYLWIGGHVPGAWDFFWDNQVMGRLMTDKYQRNPGWFGWLIYLPVLALGSLPGSLVWLKKGARSRLSEARDAWKGPAGNLLALWLLLPLAVLCLAQSRLPLYALPLFAPLALLVAPRLDSLTKGRPVLTVPWVRRTAFGCAAVFLALKAGAAVVPSGGDLRLLWRDVRSAGLKPGEELVLTEWKEEGLGFYAGAYLDTVTLDGEPYPSFIAPEDYRRKCDRIVPGGRVPVFLVPSNRAPEYADMLRWRFNRVETVALPRNRSLLRCTNPRHPQP